MLISLMKNDLNQYSGYPYLSVRFSNYIKLSSKLIIQSGILLHLLKVVNAIVIINKILQ